MAELVFSDSPVIVLPDDPGLQARLRLKLEEYKKRLDPYRHPELQLDALFKVRVLEKLLEAGEVNTYSLSLELANEIGKHSFSIDAYNNACAVINDYVTTGGVNTKNGTGLPPA